MKNSALLASKSSTGQVIPSTINTEMVANRSKRDGKAGSARSVIDLVGWNEMEEAPSFEGHFFLDLEPTVQISAE